MIRWGWHRGQSGLKMVECPVQPMAVLQATVWPPRRGLEKTYFNFLLGPPHDKGEISPNIIISQKILSGTIKREIQQRQPTKAAPKSAASKLPQWYSLIPVDENIKDDNVPLNQTPWDSVERVTGLSLLPPRFFLSLFTL